MFICQDKNEFGTTVDKHKCDTCGDIFTVCPPIGDRSMLDQWANCLSPTCGSYDPARDADKLFDDGNVMSFVGRKMKVRRGPPPSSDDGDAA